LEFGIYLEFVIWDLEFNYIISYNRVLANFKIFGYDEIIKKKEHE